MLKAEVEQAQAEAAAAAQEEEDDEEATIEAAVAPMQESCANAYESEIEPEYQLGHHQVSPYQRARLSKLKCWISGYVHD